MIQILKNRLAYFKKKTRTFFFTLIFLPASLRPTVTFAYLFARLLDDVVDEPSYTPEYKKQRIQRLFKALETQSFGHHDNEHQRTSLSSQKLFSDPELDARFHQVPESLKPPVIAVLKRIRAGFLRDIKNPVYSSLAELDRYLYCVAGSVGKFWTEICFHHYPERIMASPETMVRLGVQYGKGLQLINVLRDLSVDLAQGRQYVPGAHAGMPDVQVLALLHNLRPRLMAYLRCGLEYSKNIRYLRLRIATAMPLWIGLLTVQAFYSPQYLEQFKQERNVKIGRKGLRKALLIACLGAVSPSLWEVLFERYERR